MMLTYFKRYRMELDLRSPRPPAELPPVPSVELDWA